MQSRYTLLPADFLDICTDLHKNQLLLYRQRATPSAEDKTVGRGQRRRQRTKPSAGGICTICHEKQALSAVILRDMKGVVTMKYDEALNKEEKEETLEIIPQRRFIEPIEIARLCKYLISEDAKGLTGQSINLCAGLSCGA